MSNLAQSGSVDATGGNSFETGVIEAMADWCDALQGGASLQDAFAGLAAGLGAEAGMLVRTHLTSCKPIRIAVWDRHGASSSSPLSTSFADGFFGRHVSRPRSASVWLLSTHEENLSDRPDPALGVWQERRGLADFATLILAGGPPVRDHIELHFTHPVPDIMQAAFAAVLPTMARTWASRQVGLVSRSMPNQHAIRDPGSRGTGGGSLLGPANPARLSRAEFRVCFLLSRGLSVLGVAKELSVCEATVRSHLRSIYAKTETTNLAELVFHLLSSPQGTSDADRSCA